MRYTRRGNMVRGVQTIEWWSRACEQLSVRDPIMARLIRDHRGDCLRGSGDAFQTLLNAIVGQQISVAAASSIWRRLKEAFPRLEPVAIVTADDVLLRSVGLSLQKVAYVRGIAHAFASGAVDPAAWTQLSDAEVHAELTALRGVGPWTADMMLIFHLHRPDVLPLGDLGLVNAAARLYGWNGADETSSGPRIRLAGARRRLRDHAERWRPWRTVATWFVWRDLDAEPVVY